MTHCNGIIPPYGGTLVDLIVPEDERDDALIYAKSLSSARIPCRSLQDLTLLTVGAFSPLDRSVPSYCMCFF